MTAHRQACYDSRNSCYAEGMEKRSGKDVTVEHIRKRFDVMRDFWDPIFSEGRINMRYLSGDSWPPDVRAERERNKRLVLCFDELGQHTRRVTNQQRTQPIAATIKPISSGANEKVAEIRQGLLRSWDYKYHANDARMWAYLCAVQRGYGFYEVDIAYAGKDSEGETSFGREIATRRILEPESVMYDPSSKDTHFRDARDCMIVDTFERDEFEEQYPNADLIGFDNADAPGWVTEDSVRIVKYWKVKTTKRRKNMVAGPAGRTAVYADEPGVEGQEVLDWKYETQREVCWYIANGKEILDRGVWVGDHIPIPFVPGEEIAVPDGPNKLRRFFYGLINRSRDAQQGYNYTRTRQAEFIGLMPIAPWVGYEGQFAGNELDWRDSHTKPIAFLQAKASVPDAPGQILPIPQRPPTDLAQVQALEIVAESWRRSIMAAMGSYQTAVGKEDTAAKSGIALERLRNAADLGAAHFFENLKVAVEHEGRIKNDLLTKLVVDPREVSIMKPDDKVISGVMLNAPGIDPMSGEQTNYMMSDGEYDVIVSVGPSQESAREEATELVDSLIQTPMGPLVADLAVKARNLGPIGDEMVKRLTPPQFADPNLPPQAAAKLQEMDQQLQSARQYIIRIEEELAKSQNTAVIQQMKNESAEKIAKLEAAVELVKQEGTNDQASLRAEVEAIRMFLDLTLSRAQAEQDAVAMSRSEYDDATDSYPGGPNGPAS